jgi:general stress protein YciG
MINPYTKENPGNFANNPERARKAGHKGGSTTSERYLNEARKQNDGGDNSNRGRQSEE